MAGFLYYIPHATSQAGLGADSKLLVDAGLADRFPANCSITSRGCVGPDKERGIVFALEHGKATPTVGYYPDAQSWTKCAAGAYWIGIANDAAPDPDDLQRDRIVPGHAIELNDGNDWTVPLVQPLAGNAQIPRTIELDPDSGELIYVVKPRYQPLFETAELVWRQWRHDAEQARIANESVDHNPEPGPITTVEQWLDIAAQALAVNYRVSRWEVLALKLVDTENVVELCGLLIDMPTITRELTRLAESAEKKSGSTPRGGSDTSDGDADSSPAGTTTPHTPTSGSTPTTRTTGKQPEAGPPHNATSLPQSEPSPKPSVVAPEAGGGDD